MGITMHIIIISGCVAVVQGMCSTAAAAAPFCHSEITQQLAKDAKEGEGAGRDRERERRTDTNYNLCFEIIYGCGLNWNGMEWNCAYKYHLNNI